MPPNLSKAPEKGQTSQSFDSKINDDLECFNSEGRKHLEFSMYEKLGFRFKQFFKKKKTSAGNYFSEQQIAFIKGK